MEIQYCIIFNRLSLSLLDKAELTLSRTTCRSVSGCKQLQGEQFLLEIEGISLINLDQAHVSSRSTSSRQILKKIPADSADSKPAIRCSITCAKRNPNIVDSPANIDENTKEVEINDDATVGTSDTDSNSNTTVLSEEDFDMEWTSLALDFDLVKSTKVLINLFFCFPSLIDFASSYNFAKEQATMEEYNQLLTIFGDKSATLKINDNEDQSKTLQGEHDEGMYLVTK